MKPFLYIAGFWAVVLGGAWVYISYSDVPQPGGILAPAEPQQIDIPERSWTRGDTRFTAMAQFAVHARVLSVNHYSYDKGADLSPVDFALGWGRMSDSDILAHLRIKQSQRFYFWRPLYGEPLPLTPKDVITHSANMHMIPASDDVKKKLLDVRTGEIVSFSGYLVQVSRPNGWFWKSSLTRTDTGMGACELVWVEHIDAIGTVMQRASR